MREQLLAVAWQKITATQVCQLQGEQEKLTWPRNKFKGEIMHKYNDIFEISLNSKLDFSIKWGRKADEELTTLGASCGAIAAAIRSKHDEIMERRQGP